MQKTKILVVEDEWIVADAVRQRLEDAGYDVLEVVATGEEAVEKVEELKPDVVLMDIVLKGKMDGIEATNKIHTRSSVPVIYLTAFADKDILKRARVSEPYGYLLKPVKNRELHSTIEMALYKYRAERTLRRRNLELETMYEASSAISSSLSLKAVLNTVAEQMTQVLDCTGCGLFLRNPEENIMETLLDYSANMKDEVDPPGTTYDLKKYKTRRRVLNSRKPVVIHKTTGKADRLELAFMKTRGAHTVIMLPLMARDRVLGLATLINTSKARKYGEDEIRLSWSLAAHAAVAIDNARLYIEAKREITVRKEADVELKMSQKQFRDLSAHLQSVREKERRRVAHEIHDELGQALTALKLDVSWLGRKLTKDQEQLGDKTRSIAKLIDETIQTVRKITEELRPSLLDSFGLQAAMNWYCDDFQNRTGVQCELASEPDEIDLDQELSTVLFRIFQEALTNIARHADASMVQVSLKQQAGQLALEVSDNGKGITRKEMSGSKSFGLMGMRERAYPWGGEVEITGEKGKGTTVSVTIPIPETQQMQEEATA